MIRHKRLAVAATTLAVAALGVTGTAAAASGAPASSSPKAAAVSKAAASDAAFDAAAAALGITPDALTAAVIGAKQSFVTGGPVTDEAFLAAVADRLGLPATQVTEALTPLISTSPHSDTKPDAPSDDPKRDTKDGAGTKPEDSPLAADGAAEAFAAAAGVSVDQARAALKALVATADDDGGLQPTSKAYQDVAAGLGLTTEQLNSALGQLKRALNGA
jgi:hypothetical protein